MAAAAGLAVTLIPVLMGYLIRGRIPDEQRNPLNRALIAAVPAAARRGAAWPKLTLAVAARRARRSLWPLQHIGGEFMPPLDEGDLLYMPSALPGLSAGKAAELLQQTDRLIKTVPEVASVLRQGRPRRDGHRPGAAGDVRDDDPVQAARPMARRHDDRTSWSRSSTASCKCRACPTSGCRRSATASTCWPPASRARSA